MAGNNQPIQKRIKTLGNANITEASKQKITLLKNETLGSVIKPALNTIVIDTEKTPEQNYLTADLIDLISSNKSSNSVNPEEYFS